MEEVAPTSPGGGTTSATLQKARQAAELSLESFQYQKAEDPAPQVRTSRGKQNCCGTGGHWPFRPPPRPPPLGPPRTGRKLPCAVCAASLRPAPLSPAGRCKLMRHRIPASLAVPAGSCGLAEEQV